MPDAEEEEEDAEAKLVVDPGADHDREDDEE